MGDEGMEGGRGEEGEGEGAKTVGGYLRGDNIRIWPFLILIRPAAEMREPWRKEECWKAPDCLMPM